ncbi:RNA polymerase sigma factor [Chryseobacterium camelliae]|uniref:RNA polymerase sigma factor n=1 Tax=Chryseobacterium camelliae TaxID=1265445 RepID=UPI00285D1E3B|nr:sigma-70 family RNA polymerase sigma factor [Chryseobacterium camelliae]MDR6513686.1 RNA polymerase sigma-70 factor (ECF subfamily) [Chryseobacterium camelliae]
MTSRNVIDERALLSQFQSGDRFAFDRIFNLYHSSLLFFANRLLLNIGTEVAKDVVLDIFLKLYDRRDNFETLSNIKAFLYISVKNSCLKVIERQKVKQKRFDLYSKDFDEFERNVLDQILQTEVYQELYYAIDLLPEQYRLIMQRIVNGDTAREISEELGIPVSTINTQKSRAISLLKKSLSGAGIALLLIYS